jgi:hypothetical protein
MTEQTPFDFPVWCNGEIHIVSMYDDGDVRATTHENDPDDWIRETLSDLGAGNSLCPGVVAYIKNALVDRKANFLHHDKPDHTLGNIRFLFNDMFRMHEATVLRHYDFLKIAAMVTLDIVQILRSHLDKEFADCTEAAMGTIIQNMPLYELIDTLRSKYRQGQVQERGPYVSALEIYDSWLTDRRNIVASMSGPTDPSPRTGRAIWGIHVSLSTAVLVLLSYAKETILNPRHSYKSEKTDQWYLTLARALEDYTQFLGDGSMKPKAHYTMVMSLIKKHNNELIHSIPTQMYLDRDARDN